MTTGKNNFRFFRAHGALRLLRSSRFALTLPDRFATGVFPRAAIKAARGCEPKNRKLFF